LAPGEWGRFFPLRAGDTAILQVTPEATEELVSLRQAGGRQQFPPEGTAVSNPASP